MKTTDLMIGDWTTIKGYNNKLKVVAINGETITIADEDNHGALGDYPVSALDGIPLTPEILEKNGFRDISSHTLKGCETFCLDIVQRGYKYRITIKLRGYFKLQSYDDRWYTLCEMEFGCSFVHELQHALKLCGIEKEIVL